MSGEIAGQNSNSTVLNGNNSLMDQYNSLERKFSGTNGWTMPICFRKLSEVQLSYQSKCEENPLGDNRSVHIKALFGGTVGVLGSLCARIARVSVFTLFLPIALVVRFATATRYQLDGAIPELLNRYGEEWIDLGVTLGCCPLGIIKAIFPMTGASFVESVRGYYENRTTRREAFDKKFERSEANYQKLVELADRFAKGTQLNNRI